MSQRLSTLTLGGLGQTAMGLRPDLQLAQQELAVHTATTPSGEVTISGKVVGIFDENEGIISARSSRSRGKS